MNGITNETLRSILNRRSTRAFLPDPVAEGELRAVLDAGIYAPSASNLQPRHFSVLLNKDLLDRLSADFVGLAKQSDSEYLRKFGNRDNFHVFYHAPAVILLSGDENNRSAVTDTAASAENICIAAESMDIGSCWIGLLHTVFNSEKGPAYAAEAKIPSGYRFMQAVALGYKKDKPAEAPPRRENIVSFVR